MLLVILGHYTICKANKRKNNNESLNDFKEARAKYKEAIKLAKKQSWQDLCSYIEDIKSLSKLN